LGGDGKVNEINEYGVFGRDNRWMYESAYIIRYLEGRFVVPPVAAAA